MKGIALGVLKTDLQCRGVSIGFSSSKRTGGAGPAEGGIVLFEGCSATVPMQSDYVRKSPYTIEERSGIWVLLKGGQELVTVTFPRVPAFYGGRTAAGLPYRQIALLHGTDCLASTIYQDCMYWDTPLRCRFCGIRLSLDAGDTVREKTEEQLAEVAQAAREMDGVTHVTLTTGTISARDKGIRKLARSAAAIKQRTGLPVHAQCEPPHDSALLEQLRESGVDTVGIHIESFDPAVLEKTAPAKHAAGIKRFMESWQRAVELFGKNQVSSFILTGLGESSASTIEGSERLAAMGVYPYVVPLRPIPGSMMAKSTPPAPEELIDVYQAVSSIVHKHGLSARRSKAGCVRCGACSALPEFE